MSAQNREKLTSFPLVRKMSALAQPSSSPCPCGHSINFEKSDVFSTRKCGRPHLKNALPPCSQNVRTGQTLSPLTADILYGWLLKHFFYNVVLASTWCASFFHVFRSCFQKLRVVYLKIYNW